MRPVWTFTYFVPGKYRLIYLAGRSSYSACDVQQHHVHLFCFEISAFSIITTMYMYNAMPFNIESCVSHANNKVQFKICAFALNLTRLLCFNSDSIDLFTFKQKKRPFANPFHCIFIISIAFCYLFLVFFIMKFFSVQLHFFTSKWKEMMKKKFITFGSTPFYTAVIIFRIVRFLSFGSFSCCMQQHAVEVEKNEASMWLNELQTMRTKYAGRQQL